MLLLFERARVGHRPAHAVEGVRADLLNDARLIARQANPFRCYVCNARPSASASSSLVPILAPGGEYLWLHLDCHDEHLRRVGVLADICLQAAGLPINRNGEPDHEDR